MRKPRYNQKFFLVNVLSFVVSVIILGAIAALIPKVIRLVVFIVIAIAAIKLAFTVAKRESKNPKN